jgi:hypothetical protein
MLGEFPSADYFASQGEPWAISFFICVMKEMVISAHLLAFANFTENYGRYHLNASILQ